MGTGHVMRCLALAQEWQDAGGRALFAMAQSMPGVDAKVLAENCRIVHVAAATGSREDVNTTLEIARSCSADWIALDGYEFDCEYQREIKSAGFKLLLLDDLAEEGRFVADIIVNQNAHATEEMYAKREAYTRCLLGPGFALLRREFRCRREPMSRRGKNRVLIMMGGTDPENATGKVLDAVRSTGLKPLEIVVIVGPGAADAAIGDLSQDGCSVRMVRNPASVIEYMEEADVAVSAAGTTVLEMCRLGVPMALVAVAENQLRGALELARRGVVVYLGHVQDVSQHEIATAVRELLGGRERREHMSQLGRTLVDGQGARRVVEAMRGTGLRLRPATADDCDLLWAWANEPGVRAASFHSAMISRDEHREWFAGKLGAANARIYVAEDQQGNAVGQFRVEWDSGLDATVHISVVREKRGLGIGTELIRQGMQTAFNEIGIERFHAYAKPGNEASVRAFEKAGFSRRECEPEAIHLWFEMLRAMPGEEVLADNLVGSCAARLPAHE
jgi:UDP-2,4-diacetamido-2,4,6-trideoxy-beta-L-altropyranose hydrolase